MARRLRGLAVLHPFPSTLNALLVGALALVAGGAPAQALTIALAMLGFQVSIGALNDLADSSADALAKPWKPIPAGLVSRRFASAIALLGGGLGIVASAAFGVTVLTVGCCGYLCGVAYDLRLKRVGLGWLAFSVALPLLLCFPWLAVTGALPPRSIPLLPIALLAGPALHLANGLVDIHDDRATGLRTLAVQLGRGRAIVTLAALLVAVHALAWSSLSGGGGLAWVPVLPAGASALSVIGYLGSTSADAGMRAWGWSTQAVSMALLGVSWLAAATAT